MRSLDDLIVIFYLCVSRLRDFPEVILRPRGDLPKENLLGHSTPEHHAHPVKQLLLGEEVLFLWQVLRVPQTFPSGNDGHLGENVQVGFTHSTTIGRVLDGMMGSGSKTKLSPQELQSSSLPLAGGLRVPGTSPPRRVRLHDTRPLFSLEAAERDSFSPNLKTSKVIRQRDVWNCGRLQVRQCFE